MGSILFISTLIEGELRKKQKYLYKELIAEIKERYLQDGEASFYKDTDWCVYAKNVRLDLKSECFVLT